MTTTGSSTTKNPYADHIKFADQVHLSAPIGNKALMQELRWRQPGRFRRVRNTLIGHEVVRLEGGRGRSSHLVPGPVDIQTVITNGGDIQVGREVALYPALTDPIDQMVTTFHTRLKHPVKASGAGDGVEPYVTASMRAGNDAGVYTRPDITVIVDLQFKHLGPWNDVHAVEVKPYWAIERDGLYEAAAQAALRRCTHSWLVAYVPDVDAPGLNAEQRRIIRRAATQLRSGAELGRLSLEAKEIGIGVAVARSLREDAHLDVLVPPARQVMDPQAVDELFASLGRMDG